MSNTALRPVFTCTVIGTPVPQGSSRAFNIPGRRMPIVTSDNKNLKSWRSTCASSFIDELLLQGFQPGNPDLPLFSAPVGVTIQFLMPRTKALPKRVEKAHTVKPDLDKLIRSILDALTQARVLVDDSLVTEIRATKRYALTEESPGARVEVRELEAGK